MRSLIESGTPGPVVDDMQFQCQSIALLAESHLPGDAGAQDQLRIAGRNALRQGLAGVVRDVEHRLDQLLAVAPELGNRGVVVAHDLQAARKLRQDQRAHPLADLVDVDVAHDVRPAVRRQQAVHQRLQPIGLVDDDLGVFLQVAATRSPSPAAARRRGCRPADS